MLRPVKRPVRHVFPLIAALAALAPRTAVGDDADARRRLYEEAPVAWAKMAAYADDLTVEGWRRFSPVGPDPDKRFPDRRSLIRYSRAGESSRYGVINDPGGYGEAVVVTPDHCFALRRKSESSPYSTEAFWSGRTGTPPGLDARADFVGMVRPFARDVLGLPLGIEGDESLPRMFKDPEYRVTSVAEVAPGGRKLVKIEYEYNPTSPEESRFRGWLLLDPARLWTLRSLERVSESRRLEISIKYGDDDEEGFPSIRRVHTRSSPLGADASEGYVHDFEATVWRRRPSPEEFQLVAFGVAAGDAR